MKNKFNNQSGFVLIHFIIQIIIATILISCAVLYIQKYGFISLLILILAIIIIGSIFYFITVVYERVTKRSWDADQQKIYTIFVDLQPSTAKSHWTHGYAHTSTSFNAPWWDDAKPMLVPQTFTLYNSCCLKRCV